MPEDETFTLPPWNEENPAPASGLQPDPERIADPPRPPATDAELPLLLVGSGSASADDLERAAADATRQAIDDLGAQLEGRGLDDLSDVQVSLVRRKKTVVAIAVARAGRLR